MLNLTISTLLGKITLLEAEFKASSQSKMLGRSLVSGHPAGTLHVTVMLQTAIAPQVNQVNILGTLFTVVSIGSSRHPIVAQMKAEGATDLADRVFDVTLHCS